jgi:RNA polymerase sigma-70 factor (ECF subfamily)
MGYNLAELRMKVPEKNKAYFVEMVHTHMRIIYKICNLYAAAGDREDLKQEIIYQLWKSFPAFRGDSTFQSWMYRVSLNTAMLGLRARKVEYTRITDREAEIPDEGGTALDMENRIHQLYRQISKLNDLDKSIIFLYLEKCSYEEISGITGLSKGNVSVRLVRIREKLRHFFNLKNDLE